VYDFLGPLRVGEEAVVIGKYNDGEYWIIENPNAAGNCWLWGQYATLMGDSDGLTVLVPPPTPMPALGVGSTMISEKDSMTLVYVPAGEFQMGSEDGDDDEKPIHMVYLDAYWFDQTEVTNAMYAKCVAAGVCDEPRSTNSMFRESYYGNVDFNDYPVIYVSWYDSSAYCEWAGRRLPSEAEWEKVAGWDDDTQSQRIYPWGDDFEDGKSNFCDINCRFLGRNESYDDGYAETSPVGSYESGQSFYGAYDMAGNVWEWVDDWYDAYPGNTLEDSNYGTAYKVLRGGSWYDMNEPSLRSANRSRYYPSVTIGYDYDFRSANRSRYSSAVTRGGFDGFRCAYSP
jgi:formylglycine-generating enzyme required for sulfatase activity